jgi:MFS transporter, ENTS family, enterobactin (siderophore) exporter
VTAPKSPSLWRNRDFKVLLAGQGISALGDAVTFTALPLLVLFLTGSGLQMGIVGVLELLPDLLFGLPAGALADRWDRRRMMLYADIGRGLLIALIPLSMLVGVPTMAVVLAVTFPINLLRVLFMAAYTGSVPNLVGHAHIGPANSYFEAVFSLGFIAGPAIAGVLSAQVGPGPTLAIDAVSFMVSAASLRLVRRPLQGNRESTGTHILEEIREGIAFLAHHAILRLAVGFLGVINLLTAPIVLVLTYYITVDRDLGNEVVGLVLSAFGFGSLVGALSASRLTKAVPVGRLMLVGSVVTGSMILLLSLMASVPLMMVGSFVAGVSNSVFIVAYLTLRASLTPEHLLGRVGSTARMFTIGLNPLGMLAAGVMLDAFGGVATLQAMGVLSVAVAVLSGLSRGLRTAGVPSTAPTAPAVPSSPGA